jgi:hypothetical protein
MAYAQCDEITGIVNYAVPKSFSGPELQLTLRIEELKLGDPLEVSY